MKRVKRLNIAPVIFVLLLILVALLWVERRGVMFDEAVGDAARPVFTVEHAVLRDNYAGAAFLLVVALFSFLVWAVLTEGEERGDTGNGGQEPHVPPHSH
jgi:hypothetical protein